MWFKLCLLRRKRFNELNSEINGSEIYIVTPLIYTFFTVRYGRQKVEKSRAVLFLSLLVHDFTEMLVKTGGRKSVGNLLLRRGIQDLSLDCIKAVREKHFLTITT